MRGRWGAGSGAVFLTVAGEVPRDRERAGIPLPAAASRPAAGVGSARCGGGCACRALGSGAASAELLEVMGKGFLPKLSYCNLLVPLRRRTKCGRAAW